MTKFDVRLFLGAALLMAAPLFAGFGSTETFLPAVGRVAGQDGAQFYTTVWATNLTSVPQSFTFQFLKEGRANGSPASFADNLAPGETKVYENVVETRLGLTNALGAARITSSGEIFVSERIYNQAPGADLGNTEGLFFAGLPKSFSISAGQSASIQGINQGGDENFRYNFALLETGGGSPTVNVQVFDGSGALLGQKAYILQPYEQIQPNVADVVMGLATTNARITATVTGGTGSALLAGAQLANESQDSSGFEMTFRDSLLGGASPGGGLTAVIHDGSLLGSGTGTSPLAVNPAGLVTSVDGAHGAITLAAGSNVTITPSGSTLTISSSGGGGGAFALPFAGTISDAKSPFSVTNSGNGSAIYGLSNAATAGPPGSPVPAGVWGDASTFVGVLGTSQGSHAVLGQIGAGAGIFFLGPTASAVYGDAKDGFGVMGVSSNAAGVNGYSQNDVGVNGQGGAKGVTGLTGGPSNYTVTSPVGVWGDTHDGVGVIGTSSASVGVYGHSNVSVAVQGVSGSDTGVWGESSGAGYGVFGTSSSGTAIHAAGNFTATGLKSFIEPHPTDPTKEIRYVCLEGPESGTYFRGSGRIVNGFATIEVPEHFRIVTSGKGLTAQLTPVGAPAVLFCAHKGLDRIVVQGSSDIEFDYLVQGVRRAFPDFVPVSENRDFVPRSPDDTNLVMGLPAESIRRLKASGILNQDGTVNLETAHRLGWDQREGWNRAEQKEAQR